MVKKRKNIFWLLIFIGNLLFLTSCSKTYSVAFMVDDNVYIKETVEENKFVKKPQNPEKEGHTFIEWVDDNGNKLMMKKKRQRKSCMVIQLIYQHYQIPVKLSFLDGLILIIQSIIIH